MAWSGAKLGAYGTASLPAAFAEPCAREFRYRHWSSRIETEPLDAKASNGNANRGIAPDKNFAIIGAADMIVLL